MTQDLDGRVALVTGATGGMGHAICRRLGQAGALVVATDLGESHDLGDIDGLEYVAGDVADADHMKAAVARAVSAHGRLDCAVNAAGIEFEMVPTTTLIA